MTRRRPWLAGALSFVVPGAGQLYAGRLRRGLVLFAISLAATPAFALSALLPAGLVAQSAFVGFPLLSLAFAIGVAVDAFRMARRAPTALPRRTSQRPAAYLLLVVAGLVWTVGTTLVIRATCLHAYRISTRSMAPALEPGDRVLANFLRYRMREPVRGDVVIFRDQASGRAYVKRIVGLPGEKIQLRGGRVWVDGEELVYRVGEDGALVESCGVATYPIIPGGLRTAPVSVPANAYFVLGDNRPASQDSRSFGPVSRERIHGPVEAVFGDE